MLITKITSSLENCFLDSDFESFQEIKQISALKNERISFQILCALSADDGALRRLYDLQISGDLAEYVTVREVISVPVTMPVVLPANSDNYLRTAPGLYPDLLSPLRYSNKVSVMARKLCSLWIELDLRPEFRAQGGKIFAESEFPDQ